MWLSTSISASMWLVKRTRETSTRGACSGGRALVVESSSRAMRKVILHIAEVSRWQAAQTERLYVAESLAKEGFIHCSDPGQVRGVADRLFLRSRDLVLLTIDPQRLSSEVRLENLDGGEDLYPHVYGPIELDAVISVDALALDSEGRLVIPSLDGVAG